MNWCRPLWQQGEQQELLAARRPGPTSSVWSRCYRDTERKRGAARQPHTGQGQDDGTIPGSYHCTSPWAPKCPRRDIQAERGSLETDLSDTNTDGSAFCHTGGWGGVGAHWEGVGKTTEDGGECFYWDEGSAFVDDALSFRIAESFQAILEQIRRLALHSAGAWELFSFTCKLASRLWVLFCLWFFPR